MPNKPYKNDITVVDESDADNKFARLIIQNGNLDIITGPGISAVSVDGTAIADDSDLNNYTGWGDYADDEYDSSNTFSLTADTDYELPNNALSGVRSQLPNDVTGFYIPTYLSVSDVTGFVVGETITGGTSLDSAVITAIDSVNNFLYLETVDTSSDNFQDSETITGGTSTSTTTVSGTRIPGKILGRNGDGLGILVAFKMKATTGGNTRVDVWIDIGGSVGELYRRTVSLSKGQNVEQGFTMYFSGYTLDTWESNGGIIKLRTNAALDVYDIRTVLTRTHKAR